MKFNRNLSRIFALACISYFQLNAGGGDVAAGVLGGFGLGTVIGAATSRPSREVVYVDNSASSRNSRKEQELRDWERDLRNWERELKSWDQELSNLSTKLDSERNKLARRERIVLQKERTLKTKLAHHQQ